MYKGGVSVCDSGYVRHFFPYLGFKTSLVWREWVVRGFAVIIC